MKTAQEFYQDRAGWRSTGEERMRMRKAARMADIRENGARALDIGCRDGKLRKFLPPSVDYWGADVVPEFAAPNIRIGDVDEGIPYGDAEFDYVFAIEVLEHLTEPFRALGEIHRVLKDGGTCVLSVPNPYHVKEIVWNLLRTPDRQGHLHSWTRQAMTALLERAGFTLEATGGTYLHPPIPASGMFSRSTMFRVRKTAATDVNPAPPDATSGER